MPEPGPETDARRAALLATGDIEMGDITKRPLFTKEEDDVEPFGGWLAPCIRPNKGDVSNVVTFVIFCIGVLMRFLGRKDELASAILAFGLFGFAGGATNAIAVTMLFDKIPFLIGSGVIPRRFKDILEALKSLILDTFFEEKFLRAYVSERSADLVSAVDLKGRLERAMQADGFDAVLATKFEALASTPDGQLIATLAPMFGGYESMTVMLKPVLRAVGNELLTTLTSNFDIIDVVDVGQIRREIDRALSQRMSMLTPLKV